MSLRRLLLLQSSFLTLGALALAGLSILFLLQFNTASTDLTAAYRDLQRVFEVAAPLRTARALVVAGGDPSRELSLCARRLDALLASNPRDAIATADDWRRLVGPVHRAELDRSPDRRLGLIDESLASLLDLNRRIEARVNDLDRSSARRQASRIAILAAAALLLALAAITVGAFQLRTVTRPLERLTTAVRSLRQPPFPHVQATGPAELHQLATEFNRMASELQELYLSLETKVAQRTAQLDARTQDLARSARLASLGLLAAGVAHEINNPLSIITGYAERADRALPRTPDIDPRVAQSLAVILEQAYRCKSITDRLLALARPTHIERSATPSPIPPPIDLLDLTRRIVDQVSVLPIARGVSLSATGTRVLFPIDKDLLAQVLLNLIINALESVTGTPNPTVTVNLRHTTDAACIDVTDNGQGFDPARPPHLSQGFISSKATPTNQHLGLGLAIASALLDSSSTLSAPPTLTATSPGPGLGATFTITLTTPT